MITDTFGRPWREGLVDFALGLAGMEAQLDLRGEHDLSGRELHHTVMAQADALAAAAGLLMRKGAGLPAARVLDSLNKFQADLLLVGISVSEQGGKGTESLFLYSSEQPEPDIVKLDLEKQAEVQDFLARFDRSPELTRPWVGAAFTDTLLGEGPVVVRVVKSGPADRAEARSLRCASKSIPSPSPATMWASIKSAISSRAPTRTGRKARLRTTR